MILFGASGHAKVIIDILEGNGVQVEKIYDDNPRTDNIETCEEIVERAEEALKWLPKEKVWLNPDCGFATFANRPVNTMEIIEKKLIQLDKAKKYLREKYE